MVFIPEISYQVGQENKENFKLYFFEINMDFKFHADI